MNLPVGGIVKQGISSKDIRFIDIYRELKKGMLTGYIVLTLDGYDGFEESVLMFRKGEVVGCVYEYLKWGVVLNGEKALPYFMNSVNANFAVYDIYSLTLQQIDLVLAFNEKFKLSKDVINREERKFERRVAFSDDYAKKIIFSLKKEQPNKFDIIKKLDLDSMHLEY